MPGPAPSDVGSLDIAGFLSTYPGPALLFGMRGEVLGATAAGLVLAEEGVPAELRAVLHAHSLSRPALSLRIAMAGRGALDVTLVPLADETGNPLTLAIGADVTEDASLTDALKASRALYRDVIDCSAGFVWETDETGRFVFAGARSFAGYAASSLHGMSSHLLFQPGADGAAVLSPFESRIAVEDVETAIRAADGAIRLCRVTARPLFDADGNWSGARGLAHDATEQLHAERRLREAARRERFLSACLDAMGNRTDAQAIHGALLTALGDFTGAEAAAVIPRKLDGRAPDFGSAAASEGAGSAFVAAGKAACRAEGGIVSVDGWLAALVRSRGAGWGLLAVQPGAEGYEAARERLGFACNAAGPAMAWAYERARSDYDPHADALTGLLNRTGFAAEAGRRLLAAQCARRPAALIALDLDGFRAVNAAHGHESGDALLVAMARRMRAALRSGDLVARAGGGEFWIYLEDLPEDAAKRMASRLIALPRDGAAELQVTARLSASAGYVPAASPGTETLDGLIAAARHALGAAKGAGRACTRSAVEERP